MSAPIAHRRLTQEREKFLPGTIVSCTTLAHPPERFGHRPRTIALIELSNGTRVVAPIVSEKPFIGQRVSPRMRLSHIREDGLRVYETAYEATSNVSVSTKMPRYIIAFTGPSGVGKSTISKMFAHSYNEYAAKVPILTTRGAREGDDGEYVYVSNEEFDAMRHSGEIVSMTKIPSKKEDRQYGYRGSDIEAIWSAGKLPVVVTEEHLLTGLAEHFGRRAVLSFGLLPPGRSRRAMLSQLLHRLRTRGRDTEESIKDRLKVAERDLDFFKQRKDLFDHIEVNEDLNSLVTSVREKLSQVFHARPA